MSEYRRAVIELLGEGPDIIDVDGRWTCRWCGRVYSGTTGDNEVPEMCPSDDCPGHIARSILEEEDERRIVVATAHAEHIFWDAVAYEFPEISTGDLSPEDSVAFNVACQSVVRAWLEANR